MYGVFLERAAEKDLRDLPSKLHNRIIVVLQKLAKNPRPSGCRKLSGSDSDWRIRVGDYRVVYEIDDAAEVVREPRETSTRSVSLNPVRALL
jgi:mRNA interferase RelE/StbE